MRTCSRVSLNRDTQTNDIIENDLIVVSFKSNRDGEFDGNYDPICRICKCCLVYKALQM